MGVEVGRGSLVDGETGESPSPDTLSLSWRKGGRIQANESEHRVFHSDRRNQRWTS